MVQSELSTRSGFQSPLHRGILCNNWLKWLFQWFLTPFSPLFIGEYSATNMGASIAPWVAHAFQSPLHRGILCNRGAVFVDPTEVVAFSPLFIGEYSATAAASLRAAESAHLSVPSSSGNTLQREPDYVLHSSPGSFQSPLHRGILCNRS